MEASLKTFLVNFFPTISDSEPLLQQQTLQQQTLQQQSRQQQVRLPQVLTHQLYLDVRRSPQPLNSYLSFIQKTYYNHFKDSLFRSWTCTAAAFYFFIQAFYPNGFKHYAQDLIIDLSETILDEYSVAFEKHAAESMV
jgi:hypothetical protein